MDEKLEDAKQDVLKSFEKVREDLGDVFVCFETVRNATAYDDISKALDELEKAVKDVRTGGVLGRGANSHRRAREKWLQLGGKLP